MPRGFAGVVVTFTLYPCKPDIFAASCDADEEQPNAWTEEEVLAGELEMADAFLSAGYRFAAALASAGQEDR